MSTIDTLHILNKTPEHPRSANCRRALKSGDALLLTESAVLALAAPLSEQELAVPVYALIPDIEARGLDEYSEAVTLVDFSAMVDLTAHAQNVISW